MEFQAYPTSSGMAKRKDFRTFLRLQNVLHSTDSVILPATLLVSTSILMAYQHFTEYDTGRNSIRNFLVKILVSMIPLAILERRILQCSDPVGLFARFSVKVMLMHACFLGLRVSSLLFEGVELEFLRFNIIIFLAACVLLPTVFGMRLCLAGLWEQRDVWALAFASLVLACLEVSIFSAWKWKFSHMRHRVVEDVIITGSDYIEILAFVPAVWMAYRKHEGTVETHPDSIATSLKRALALFAFMVLFYSVEDVAHAVDLRKRFPTAALGHVAHYLLLLDFAGFLLAHLSEPEKFEALKGHFMTWVSDVCAV